MKLKLINKDKNCEVTDALDSIKKTIEELELKMNSEGAPIPDKQDEVEETSVDAPADTVVDEPAVEESIENPVEEVSEVTEDVSADPVVDESAEDVIEVPEETFTEITDTLDTVIESATELLTDIKAGVIDSNKVHALNKSAEKYLKFDI